MTGQTQDRKYSGLKVLETAIRQRDPAAVMSALRLYQGADIMEFFRPLSSSRDSQGLNVYEYAITLGDAEILDLLMGHFAYHPPELAAYCLKLKNLPAEAMAGIFRCLAKHGVKLDEPLDLTISVTRFGRFEDQLPLRIAVELDSVGDGTRLEALLEAGADANAHHNGLTAPALAIDKGHLPSIRRLLSAGAREMPAIPNLCSLLTRACVKKGRRGVALGIKKEIVQTLLDAGFDPNLEIDDAPIIFDILFDEECTADIVEQLLQGGLNPHSVRARDGQTLLHRAVSRNDPEIVKLLLRHGADIHAKDSAGRTPICMAATGGSTINAEDLKEVVGALLDAGADLYLAPAGEKTPYDSLNLAAAFMVASMKRDVRKQLKLQMQDGSLRSKIEKDGAPSPWMLRFMGLGILEEIAQPENWADLAQGLETWRRMRALAPVYWRGKMDIIDDTALQKFAVQSDAPLFTTRLSAEPLRSRRR